MRQYILDLKTTKELLGYYIDVDDLSDEMLEEIIDRLDGEELTEALIQDIIEDVVG